MLDFMRRHARSGFIKVLLWIIVAVFVLWGVGTFTGGPSLVAATVNGEDITPEELARTAVRLEDFYRRLYGEAFTPEVAQSLDLRTRALDQLVSRILLRQEAERLGLGATDDEVRDAIASIEGLTVDGRFRRDIYRRFVRGQGMTPLEFEELQRDDLLVRKIQELITSSVRVDEKTARELWSFENERASLRFVRVSATGLESEVEVTDQDVAGWFETNQERFREAERARISFLAYEPSSFEAKVEPTDAEVEAEYELHRDDRYTTPEQVRARHLLVRVEPGATEEERTAARERAEAALARVEAGEEFAAVAKDVSDDVSNKEDGGDLGFFPRGRMVPPFEEAAFALEAGETSGVVETQFGYHVIRVEERNATHTKTLDEAREEIEGRIRAERAREIAREAAYDDAQQALAGQPLEQLAQARGLEVESSPAFARNESVPGLGPATKEIVESAFGIPVGEVGPAIESGDSTVIFRVEEKVPSRIPPLDEVRSRVESALRSERALERAREEAEAIRERLVAGETLDAIAAEKNLEIEDTGLFARSANYVPKLGAIDGVVEDAFSLEGDEPVGPEVYVSGRDAIVVVLGERKPADVAEFESKKDEILDRYERREHQIAIDGLLNRLKTEARVTIQADALPPS